jgi:hypothetical protein
VKTQQNKRIHNHCKQIAIVGYRFERFSCVPYLGLVINDDNSLSEEIMYRIKKGNWAYYAYKGLINKYTKWKIYVTLIRLVVAY